MSNLTLHKTVLTSYQKWIDEAIKTLESLEENIRQADKSDKVQEKISSIVIAMLIMVVVSSLAGLVGFAAGAVGTVVFFMMGLILSIFINRKIFGAERSERSLSNNEKQLLEYKTELLEKLKIRKLRLRFGKEKLVCDHYFQKLEELEQVARKLSNCPESKLALKYRARQVAMKLQLIAMKVKLEKILSGV